MRPVCSNKPRPSVHKGPKGSQHWLRDVHHIADGPKTLCGRDASDWLTIDATVADSLASPHCCVRCAALAAANPHHKGE
jgi:hypothetical protein